MASSFYPKYAPPSISFPCADREDEVTACHLTLSFLYGLFKGFSNREKCFTYPGSMGRGGFSLP